MVKSKREVSKKEQELRNRAINKAVLDVYLTALATFLLKTYPEKSKDTGGSN